MPNDVWGPRVERRVDETPVEVRQGRVVPPSEPAGSTQSGPGSGSGGQGTAGGQGGSAGQDANPPSGKSTPPGDG